MLKRTLYGQIIGNLLARKAMVFIAGPRQCGKTTLAKDIASEFDSIYANWDIIDDKRRILSDPYFFASVDRTKNEKPLVIFDEIHKYRQWKNYLKGVFDKYADLMRFLVTGSGRLALFSKGGDSLAGRYLLCNMFPFTIAELLDSRRDFSAFRSDMLSVPAEKSIMYDTWDRLSRLSGFPEPYTSDSVEIYRTWARTYDSQIIREDIRSATAVRDIDTMETLFLLLASKAGSPLSLNSLAGDIRVSHDSIRTWLDVFERFYLIFRIAPWATRISRGIRKEKKLYVFNHPTIEGDGARFENMVACELFRAVNTWNDQGFGSFSLTYIRTKDGEEVDFLIADKRSPVLLIETKLSDTVISKPLLKFQRMLNVPAVQLVNTAGVHQRIRNGTNDVLAVSAPRWLSQLP